MDASAENAASNRVFRRTLSPNELSYFLPSRASGLNDMFTQVIIHAPPAPMSPRRVHIAWTITRLRYTLLSCRVEMPPGRYDQAEFVYTPPPSPSSALHEATSSLRIRDDIRGHQLIADFLNGPRTLSSDCLARLDLVRHGEVESGKHEYHIMFSCLHMIGDLLGVQQMMDGMFRLLGGAGTTDDELQMLLEREWDVRWRAGGIAVATEARIAGLGMGKLAAAAWKVDYLNVQRRSIGAHVFPRIKAPRTNIRLIQIRFSHAQTAEIFKNCKANGTTAQNVFFALCNWAWIRLCAAHPEIGADRTLPMLMYTAVSLRRHLTSDVDLSLALDYTNVVLPSFMPRNIDERRILWERARSAQKQVARYARSPYLLQRSLLSTAARAQKAKMWARIDDGLELPSVIKQKAVSPPSLALLGVTHAGDVGLTYRPHLYPELRIQTGTGGSRKGPGGLLLGTRLFFGRFLMSMNWDDACVPSGLMMEFWSHVVDGMHSLVMQDESLGRGEPVDWVSGAGVVGRSKL
ncbi:unnamed protein product [Mycena citricolor]|uniref:Uncharacterized protein n=1 Tax=Mycena citricolor TaxID=2018698 RepID=A0AAD2HIT4_9AGAR|nr:unnamed protein product [Mycena citricolor]